MSFGNFEHLEGINPSDQFDRLGNKEDLMFSSESLPADLNDQIKNVEVKVNELKETIRTRGEEEEKLNANFLVEKGIALHEAQAELAVLRAKVQGADVNNQENKKLKENLRHQEFLN